MFRGRLDSEAQYRAVRKGIYATGRVRSLPSGCWFRILDLAFTQDISHLFRQFGCFISIALASQFQKGSSSEKETRNLKDMTFPADQHPAGRFSSPPTGSTDGAAQFIHGGDGQGGTGSLHLAPSP